MVTYGYNSVDFNSFKEAVYLALLFTQEINMPISEKPLKTKKKKQ
jgi:hypothetical protein